MKLSPEQQLDLMKKLDELMEQSPCVLIWKDGQAIHATRIHCSNTGTASLCDAGLKMFTGQVNLE